MGRCNDLRKQKIIQTLEEIDSYIVAVEDIAVDEGVEQQARKKKRVQYTRPTKWRHLPQKACD